MSLSYIKRAEQGNHSALFFILSYVVSFITCIGSILLAPIFLYAAIILKKSITKSDKPLGNTMEQLTGHFPFHVSYVLLMLGFAMIVFTVWFCIRFIHRRKFGTIWSDQDKFRPKEFIKGIVFSILLFGISDLIVSINNPGYLKWVFNPEKFWIMLPLVIIFVPIQSLAEELIFRGHFYQGFGLAFNGIGKTFNTRLPSKWISLVICSFIFGALHFTNSEMGIDAFKVGTVYVGSGLLIGLMVILSKGIEFSWAFHLVNNLYLSTIVSFPGSTLDGPTLFVKPKPSADWILSEFLVEVVIVLLALVLIYRKNLKTLFRESI